MPRNKQSLTTLENFVEDMLKDNTASIYEILTLISGILVSVIQDDSRTQEKRGKLKLGDSTRIVVAKTGNCYFNQDRVDHEGTLCFVVSSIECVFDTLKRLDPINLRHSKDISGVEEIILRNGTAKEVLDNTTNLMQILDTARQEYQASLNR